MTTLIFGLLIWTLVHYFKRLMPSTRASLDAALGQRPAKGIIASLLLISIVLMVIGYRSPNDINVFSPIAGMGYLNNLLMFIAVLLFGMGSSKGKMRAWFRHPMLMGVIIWSIAHLIIRGDLASVTLFGGMAIWALIQMALVNRAVPDWTRPNAGPMARDIRLFVIAAVLYALIASIHIWLGYNPFLVTNG